MLLGITPRVHVDDEAGRPVRLAAPVSEGQHEVGLADTRRAVRDGEGAREKPSAQHRVEPGKAGRDSRGGGHEVEGYGLAGGGVNPGRRPGRAPVSLRYPARKLNAKAVTVAQNTDSMGEKPITMNTTTAKRP